MSDHHAPRAERAAAEVRTRVLSPRSMSGLAVNLSESGMLLEIERPPLVPIGKDIQLQFQLPDAPRAITTRATVTRHDGKNRMGIRFVMMPSDELVLIRAFIAQGSR
jgi:hypothetical protein